MEGQLARAKILAEQVTGEARALGDQNLEANAAALRAEVLLLEGDLAGAGKCLEIAGRRTQTGGLPNATTTALTLTSATLSRLEGKLDLAVHQLERARPTSDESTDPSLRLEETELFLSQGLFGNAQRAAKQALAILKNLKRVSPSAHVTALLSDSYGYNNQFAEARDTAHQAEQLLSPRSAPLARITVLIAVGRWTTTPSEGEKRLLEAIGLAHRLGYQVAESEATKVFREKYAAARIARMGTFGR